jgi:hypothetical protein
LLLLLGLLLLVSLWPMRFGEGTRSSEGRLRRSS